MSYDKPKPLPPTPSGQTPADHYKAKSGRILKKSIDRVEKLLHPGFKAAVIIVAPDGQCLFAANMTDKQARGVVNSIAKKMKEGEAGA